MKTLCLIADKAGMLWPADEDSRWLLRHCAFGMISVSSELWKEQIKFIVEAHGWAWMIAA